MTAPERHARVAAVLTLLASSLLAASGLAQSSEFSPAERRQLLAGELVRRDGGRTEGRSRLFGGTSWIRVRAPIDRVWRTLRDTRVYPRLIPSLERVRVVERTEDGAVLQMHHSMGIATADYYTRMSFDDAEHTVRFELDRSRPSELRSGRGFMTLTAYRGETIVAWGMLADVGAGMIQQLFGPFLNDWMLKPPRCLRDELEPGRVNEC
ncbi:MAG: SRPBCC family protein [Sandaracinaceae bacterium]|nr:SRPBCC family protein [Sandaracinaceae bacterium]